MGRRGPIRRNSLRIVDEEAEEKAKAMMMHVSRKDSPFLLFLSALFLAAAAVAVPLTAASVNCPASTLCVVAKRKRCTTGRVSHRANITAALHCHSTSLAQLDTQFAVLGAHSL